MFIFVICYTKDRTEVALVDVNYWLKTYGQNIGICQPIITLIFKFLIIQSEKHTANSNVCSILSFPHYKELVLPSPVDWKNFLFYLKAAYSVGKRTSEP